VHAGLMLESHAVRSRLACQINHQRRSRSSVGMALCRRSIVSTTSGAALVSVGVKMRDGTAWDRLLQEQGITLVPPTRIRELDVSARR